MGFKEFSTQTAIRLVLLFAVMLGLAFAIATQTPLMVSVTLAIIAVLLTLSLFRYVNRTNKELTNFLSGLRFGDYLQTFSIGHLGKTFGNLENVLTLTVEKVKKLRFEKERQAMYFQALVEHIPLPLFVLHPDGRVEVLNNATRRTFNVADITNVDELENFGVSFLRDVIQIEPGEQLLTTIQLEGSEAQYILSATQITLKGSIQKLVSLQNVQSQLDATELATWQNLLRVTSHEILNSLTPVSSLARTAKSLVDDLKANRKLTKPMQGELQDIGDALETLVRRSEGLTGFVQSYRQLTRLPPPKMTRIKLGGYLKRLEALIRPDWDKQNIRLTILQKPSNIILVADEDMLDQALINLLRNAADALKGRKGAQVWIRAFYDGQQRVVLEIADNGPGIEDDMMDKIFVPFFTTKKQGSGVGLTLVRYIALSHGASITHSPRPGGGAIFRMVF